MPAYGRVWFGWESDQSAARIQGHEQASKFRRCLIPADGFYEWSRTEKAKQPYCFEVNEGELFAFAGIWDRWKDPSGNAVETCSILTTAPNLSIIALQYNRLDIGGS